MQGQNLFNDKEDHDMYLELLSKYKAQRGFKLFSFVLLPTHIHMLIETKPETSLSDIMHNITSSYTKYFNKKYGRQGHLFRGRFRAIIIEKESHLLKLTRYIHLNPVLVNLASSAKDYPYSSYSCYLDQALPACQGFDLKNEKNEVLSYLKDKSYEDFMKEDARDENKQLHKELSKKGYLGSEEFGKRIQEKIEQASNLREAVVGDGRAARRLTIPLLSGLALAALAASILISTHKATQKASVAVSTKKNAIPQEIVIPFELVGLDGSVWQIKFIAGTPFQTVDIINFNKGKMSSENLNLNGYPASNYSMTKEAGRVIWETMQTSSAGTASWRGEVESGKMRGVLSLRTGEKGTQDFSFVSLKYSKIENSK